MLIEDRLPVPVASTDRAILIAEITGDKAEPVWKMQAERCKGYQKIPLPGFLQRPSENQVTSISV